MFGELGFSVGKLRLVGYELDVNGIRSVSRPSITVHDEMRSGRQGISLSDDHSASGMAMGRQPFWTAMNERTAGVWCLIVSFFRLRFMPQRTHTNNKPHT